MRFRIGRSPGLTGGGAPPPERSIAYPPCLSPPPKRSPRRDTSHGRIARGSTRGSARALQAKHVWGDAPLPYAAVLPWTESQRG